MQCRRAQTTNSKQQTTNNKQTTNKQQQTDALHAKIVLVCKI